MPEENVKQPAKRKKKESLSYQNDNEIIIQPLNVKEPKSSGAATLLNVGIGLIIGLAACYFLVVPAKVSDARNEAQKTITEISNNADAKTVTIQELEAQIAKLQGENDNLNQELEGYVGADGTLQTIDNLLAAAAVYLENQNIQDTAVHLEAIAASVNVEETSEDFQKLYNTLLTTIGPELAGNYYSDGFAAYRSEDFTTAIELLSKAVYYDATSADALYYLGQAYRKNDDKEKAIATFEKVIELFPDTQNATNAQRNIGELNQSAN